MRGISQPCAALLVALAPPGVAEVVKVFLVVAPVVDGIVDFEPVDDCALLVTVIGIDLRKSVACDTVPGEEVTMGIDMLIEGSIDILEFMPTDDIDICAIAEPLRAARMKGTDNILSRIENKTRGKRVFVGSESAWTRS